jgi:cytoskeleton protein RodZ
MSEPDPNQKEEGGGPSPGDRLQSARISIGMTVEEVASKMHLSPAILTNLEENNFDEITAPIFVKGYLRSYARIVRLDEDEIIQQYVRFHAGGDPPISSTSNTAREINAGDVRVRGVTWVVILVLLGLLALWWWNRYQQPAQPVSLDGSSPAQTTVVEPADFVVEPEVIPETVVSADEPMVEPASSEVSERETEAPTSVLADSAVVSEPLSVEPESAATSMVEPIVESELPEQDQAQSLSTGEEDESGLVIVVNADTWTDIRDADGNKLIYDLLRAGNRIEVDGKQPFNAFFGNAYGVEISHQGEKIDLSSRVRADNTARVRIGQ